MPFNFFTPKFTIFFSTRIHLFSFSKRFFPGNKPTLNVGHAKKVLDLINKAEIAQPSKTQGSTYSQSHIPQQNPNNISSSTKPSITPIQSNNDQFNQLKKDYNQAKHSLKSAFDNKSKAQVHSQHIKDKVDTQLSPEVRNYEPKNISHILSSNLNKETVIKKEIMVKNNFKYMSSNLNDNTIKDNSDLSLSEIDLIIPTPPLSLGITNNTTINVTQNTISINEPFNVNISNRLTLKNPEGSIYETDITPYTHLQDLSEQKLIDEGLKRHLIKKTNSPAVFIETEQNGLLCVGNKNNDLILTKNGHAYHDTFLKNNKQHYFEEDNKKEFITDMFNNLCILVPKNLTQEENIIKESQHMIAAYDPKTENLYAFSMLTSQKIGIKINENEQFRKFQLRQLGTLTCTTDDLKSHNKAQYLRPFDNIQVLLKDDVYKAKFGKEYLSSNTLDDKQRTLIENLLTDLSKKPYEKYMPKIITNEDLLKICQLVDAEAQKPKPKHPQTFQQKQQQQASILAKEQKEKEEKIGLKLMNQQNNLNKK